jgi:hypothetical protein
MYEALRRPSAQPSTLYMPGRAAGHSADMGSRVAFGFFTNKDNDRDFL